jgi:hypothetical protein
MTWTTRLVREVGVAAWPAFVAACAIEMIVFAFVDPASLHTAFGAGELGLSDLAIYSIAFLAFWALVAVACTLTLRLASAAEEINAEVDAR